LALFVDLFGYLSVVLHGLTSSAQAFALGGVLFVLLLARPLAATLGADASGIGRRAATVIAIAAIVLAIGEASALALDAAVLADTIGLSLGDTLTAPFAVSGMVQIAAALLLARGVLAWRERMPAWLLIGAGAVILGSATASTHAAARVDGRLPLLFVEALHQFGAAIWIGGLPCLLLALAGADRSAWRAIGRRYSAMSITGVIAIALSGGAMAVAYIGSLAAGFGTAYGVMVGAKITMFLLLLGLGALNNRLIGRIGTKRAWPPLRLRRFVEAEIGIGIAIFFAAASLTSVPPAIDLTTDRASLAEIGARFAPAWPRLTSPDHDALALPQLQARLDAEAAAARTNGAAAFTPGGGELPPRNADDVAWSEYNHHWAGIAVLLIGVLALLARAGVGAARHWPLLFVAMAAFLFFRADPEVWPLGSVGFFASFRDIEVLQHRVFEALIAVFGLFEWLVQRAGRQAGRAALVFPLITASGAVLLLTHSHALANVKELLLIEYSHTPLALLGIVAAWARWLEIRLDPLAARVAGWVWPICFVLVGALLLDYREA